MRQKRAFYAVGAAVGVSVAGIIVARAARTGGGLAFEWPWLPSEAPEVSSSKGAAPSASDPIESEPFADDPGRGDGGRLDDRPPRALELPSTTPMALSCRDARRIVAQVRSQIAAPPDPIDPAAFADGVADWLDPHGLWSAAPDAPLGSWLHKRASDLLDEIQKGPASEAPCATAHEAGVQLGTWVGELRSLYDQAFARAETMRPDHAFRLATEPMFEDHTIAKPARELARELGDTLGVLDRAYGRPLARHTAAAEQRYLPKLSADAWAGVVLTAAVRAYVPQLDPHGGWAPLDEETSLYEIDLEASPPARLWDQMVRTAIGLRIDSGAVSPLLAGDLVIEVAGVTTAGLSVEQIEQLSIVEGDDEQAHRLVTVLRPTDPAPQTLDVAPPPPSDADEDQAGTLPVDRIPFGDGTALVVTISDVPDDLGELLSHTLATARADRPRGILLDLRGNGGGSTDGANAALGLFMPGVPLFPMKRRDGEIEVERAPAPPVTDRWTGPVAALVDGDTASAAEMIAGALLSYHRGMVAGARTYGKGCAQEYLDDEAHAGVLRLTTLVYALPDGSPVQKVGLLPSLQLGLGAPTEREGMLPHAVASWRGPDVRDRARVGEVPWPAHHGRVGPCQDEAICRVLRAAGAPRTAIARGRH